MKKRVQGFLLAGVWGVPQESFWAGGGITKACSGRGGRWIPVQDWNNMLKGLFSK